MSRIVILGVDPGIHGALAFFNPELELTDPNVAWLVDMTTIKAKRGKSAFDVDGVALAATLETAIDHGLRISHAVVEHVQSRPRQGSQFVFGVNYGRILGVLEATGVPIKHVSPSKWKPEMGLRGESKAKSVELAAALFPGLKDQFYGPRGAGLDGRAEAILLAYYGAKLR